MHIQDVLRLTTAAALLVLGCLTATAADKAAMDKAFEALKTYDWGKEVGPLKPIDDAVTAARSDAVARKDLEIRLAAVLRTDAPRDAKDFVCRKLMVIGTAESVPTLAGLLPDKDLSHMARYALERIPAPEAGQALRDSLKTVTGPLQIGVIGSLGVRRDAASVELLTARVTHPDTATACAACCALGNIGTPEASKVLLTVAKKQMAAKVPEAVTASAADAALACAERLLADGKKAEALAVYKSLAGEDQPKQIRTAATRGLLAVAGKKD
jgi:hypothetical protein